VHLSKVVMTAALIAVTFGRCGPAVATPGIGTVPAGTSSPTRRFTNDLKQLPLTAADAALVRAKDDAVRAHFQRKVTEARSGSGDSFAAVSATLPVTRQIQQTDWWCGPATVSEILTYKGRGISQTTAANQLRTTTDGTNWYGSNNHPSPDPKWNTNFPVRDVLNHNLITTFYVPRDWVNKTTASSSDQSLFKWAVRGYANSGNTAAYVDSANFGGAVPGYSNYDAGDMAIIIAGRGYIW